MRGKFHFLTSARNGFLLCFAVAPLCACSLGSTTIDLTENPNVHDAIEAATGPLQDLNLRRQEIPPLLLQAGADPYGQPTKTGCDGVREELAELTTLLGPDIEPAGVKFASTERDGLVASVEDIASVENTEIPDEEAIMKKAKNFAHDSVMDAIRSHTDFLPFRSIIRKISGANRYQKKVAKAYEAGKLRRAYLKGMAQERYGVECLTPKVVEAKVEALQPLPLADTGDLNASPSSAF